MTEKRLKEIEDELDYCVDTDPIALCTRELIAYIRFEREREKELASIAMDYSTATVFSDYEKAWKIKKVEQEWTESLCFDDLSFVSRRQCDDEILNAVKEFERKGEA